MGFTVTYNGNGASSGSVPVDPNSYTPGATVSVLDNTGGLAKAGGTFAYWNTAANGSGAVFGHGTKFTITSDTTLYAQWFVTDGLTGGGVTTHFAFSYDSALKATAANPTGPEPARTNAVIAAVENDYNLMASWFGGITLTVPVPLVTQVANLGLGASWGPPVTLMPGGGDPTLMRYLIVSEVTEMFMLAQNRGWFGAGNEGSAGEGLSRFLAEQFLIANHLGVTEPGFALGNSWMTSPRADFVNHVDVTDHGIDPKTGCAILFIYYLHTQLGFEVNEIIAAAASELSQVYRNLTHDASDPFQLFKRLLDGAYPGTTPIPGPNPDNPWPLVPKGDALVPNLLDLSLQDARDAVQAVGLTLRSHGIGVVVGQRPTVGIPVQVGSVVNVWLRSD
jgi:hypothetical protein